MYTSLRGMRANVRRTLGCVNSTLSKIADGIEIQMPATIDDSAILAEIEAKLQAIGVVNL